MWTGNRPLSTRQWTVTKCICFQSRFTDVFSHSCPGDGTNQTESQSQLFTHEVGRVQPTKASTGLEGICHRSSSSILTPHVEDWWCDGAELLAVGISVQQYAVALHVMIQTPQLDLHLADAETRLRLQFFFKLKYFLKADTVNKILNRKSLLSHPYPPLFLKSLQKQFSQHSKKLPTVLWWTGS